MYVPLFEGEGGGRAAGAHRGGVSVNFCFGIQEAAVALMR